MVISDHSEARVSSDAYAGQRGSVLLELVTTLIPFLMLVVVSIQGAVIGLTSLSIYYSVNRAAREASVSTAGTDAARVAAIVAAVTTYASGLGVDTSDLTVRVCPLLNPGCAGQDPAGGNHYFVVSAQKAVRVFWGLGSIAIGAKAMSRNEPI